MLNEMIRIISLVFTIYGCLDISMPDVVNEFVAGREGGRCRYLTNLAIYLAVITMSLGMIQRYAISKRMNLPCKERISMLHTYMVAVSLPINFAVFFIYWPILFHDVNHFRRMEVFNKGGVVSTFTDLCQHLIPQIGMICEFQYADISKSTIHTLSLIVFGVGYYIYCMYVSSKNGLWPYPFLERISPLGRFVFFSSIILISLGVYEAMFCLKKSSPEIKNIESKKNEGKKLK